MSLPDPNAATDREIWVASRAMGAPRSENCPSALELASYADGRLGDETQRERIESHLADCAECLDAVLAVRAGDAESHPLPSPATIEAARRLVEESSRDVRPASSPVLARIGRWSLAAATAIAVSVTGYWLGLHSTPPPPPIQNGTVSDVSFGLFETSDTDAELDELFAALEELSS